MKYNKHTAKKRVENKRKYRKGEWHHRVPDFKLVYCGPKKNILEKESEKAFLIKSMSQTDKEDQQDHFTKHKIQ